MGGYYPPVLSLVGIKLFRRAIAPLGQTIKNPLPEDE